MQICKMLHTHVGSFKLYTVMELISVGKIYARISRRNSEVTQSFQLFFAIEFTSHLTCSNITIYAIFLLQYYDFENKC